MTLTRNVGTMDKAIRVVVGLALLSLAVVGPHWAFPIALLGAIPLATALVGWCPLYRIAGINTCRMTPSSKTS